VETYGRAGQATDDNMAHAYCMLDNEGYKRTLRIYIKGNAVPLQTWTGPEGSRRLRLPDFKTVST